MVARLTSMLHNAYLSVLTAGVGDMNKSIDTYNQVSGIHT